MDFCLILNSFIPFNVIWSIIGWIIAALIIFIEVPLCLKCCPTSPKFDAFMSKFQNSYLRAAGYTVFAILLWIAVSKEATRVVPALFLTITAISYAVSAFRNQTPTQSTLTGGAGVSTIV
ncbi:Golgi apparatus membrane protein tvp18 [Actinomortierella wolfii]|nr:Golgi apparatus membrane protein tvp18 [Actinomortierella wolfii]